MSTWSCPACTYLNGPTRVACEMCNTKKKPVADNRPSNIGSQAFAAPPVRAPVPLAASSWNCPACTYTNASSKSKCEMCESSRPLLGIPATIAVGVPVRQQAPLVAQSSVAHVRPPPALPALALANSGTPHQATSSRQVVDRMAEVQNSPRNNQSQTVFASWLKKKSPKAVMGRHIWEARYFVLYSDRLLYFRRYDDSFDLTKFAGCIMLADIDSVIAMTSSSSSTRYRFNIQLANSDKVFQLMSDGEEVDKGKKWNVLLLDMLPERGGAKVGVGKFWKPGAESSLPEGASRRRASSIRRQNVYVGRTSFSGPSGNEQKKDAMNAEDKDLVSLVMSDTRVALKSLDMLTKEKILSVMFKKQFQTGQVVVRAGEPSSLFYVVKSGSFSAQRGVNKKTTFSVGTCFGEEDILSEQNSSVTITAMEESVCWCLERNAYREVLVQSNLGRSAQYLAFLTANHLLSTLSESDLRQLAGALEEAEYGVGEEIVTQGDVGESFYIVKSGECEVVKDGMKVAHYWEGDSFGERALLQGLTRAATVVAVTEVVVLALDRTTFTNLLGPLESIKTKQAKEEKPPELAGYSVGDRLEVQTPKGPQKGTVKYVGYPHFTRRARLGLELDLAMGKHDGHSKGQRYFKCASKHGIFVAADEVISVLSKAKIPKPTPTPKANGAVKFPSSPTSNSESALDLFELMSAAPSPGPASAPNYSDLFLSQPEGPRLVNTVSSNDPFAAISKKPTAPPPPPSTSSFAPADDPFGALALSSKPTHLQPQTVSQTPPKQLPSASSILDDIFSSQEFSQQPSGPDLSLMTGPIPWISPQQQQLQQQQLQQQQLQQQQLQQSQTGDFVPSNFANNFLASLSDDLDDMKIGPRTTTQSAKKPHLLDQVSDDDSDTEEGKQRGGGKPKVTVPASTQGLDDFLFEQLGLSVVSPTASSLPIKPLPSASNSPVPSFNSPSSIPTKPPPSPASAPPSFNSIAPMPTKPPPAPSALMMSLGVVSRQTEAKDPFSILDSELALKHAPRQTRFSTDEEFVNRPEAKVERKTEMKQPQVAMSIIVQPPRDHKPCKVDEFLEVGELGRGTFGTVKLVADPHTQFTFALKTIDKQYLLKQNQVEFVKNERLCLSMMDNPFLIKMYNASMDIKNIYFVLEPAMGGELFNLLNEKERFNQDQSRFYAASIVMAFEYMHAIGIVYRDLKPENILLDDVGYVKLTDFGFAKQLGTGKTNTFCGTPDYLSPEIVGNKGHGFGTDWWCLGILIYEMLTGTTPFFHEGGPLLMYEKIVNAQVSYPDYISEEARDLIGGLLSKNEAKRIGVLAGGANLIKQHPFFDGFDWKGLVNRTLPAPFLKPLKDKYDLTHFAEQNREDVEGDLYY